MALFLKNILAKSKFVNKISSGFTLIELVVVMGIMMIVTTVVIYNFQNFNSTTLVTNYAYEVAFAVKEAQVYGLSVLKGGSVSTAGFLQGYGVHLDNASLDVPATFILFADFPLDYTQSPVGDGVYASSTQDSLLKTYSFAGRYKVKQFCVPLVSGGVATDCASTIGTKMKLDITFVRPNPDARIKITEEDSSTRDNLSSAEITIVSPQGSEKKIVVYSTGQISIQNSP
ncbi:MAG: type II secretion system protein [Candidatus Pacebacteria bacterium]|nr:type II secretion system protein [Candidatus Paceibacterota bacterium]